jgi:RHS repeat-associated protein
MTRLILRLCLIALLFVAGAARAQTLYFVHPDHLDTPRLITDAAGTVVWRWDNREPFGDNAPNADPDVNGVFFAYNLRLPGQYHDAETGNFYNYFRDYDPRVGRYLESDPIGLGGGCQYLRLCWRESGKSD